MTHGHTAVSITRNEAFTYMNDLSRRKTYSTLTFCEGSAINFGDLVSCLTVYAASRESERSLRA